MSRGVRIFLYALILLVWLVVMALPVVAIHLSRQEELTLGNTRLFLVISDKADGLGLQSSRPVRTQPQCQRVSVRYFFWDGGEANANAISCACADGVDRIWQAGQCLTP